ncbi:MAG TPA: hypothetical protein VGM92_15520 [Candidatus Kapabacteria bacterium]|jgi:hypothetical protein
MAKTKERSEAEFWKHVIKSVDERYAREAANRTAANYRGESERASRPLFLESEKRMEEFAERHGIRL